MMFNVTFNNISVILWQSVLLVQENGGPRENNRPATTHRQILSNKVVSSTPLHERDLNSYYCLKIGSEMKNKQYNTVGIVLKSNRKIRETEAIL